jgi:hypothetical protein
VIDSGAYEQKLVTGTARKLVFVWLYWTPEPPADLPPTPSPRKASKKGGKKGVKKEKTIKAEKVVKTEPEPTSKRSRAISGEVSTSKRVVTRQQIKAQGEEPATGEGLLEGGGEGGGEDPDDNEVAVN